MSELEQQVMEFISEQTAVPLSKLSLETTIFGELGIDGDDGIELIEDLGKRFNVNLSSFDAKSYFGPEAGCLFPISMY